MYVATRSSLRAERRGPPPCLPAPGRPAGLPDQPGIPPGMKTVNPGPKLTPPPAPQLPPRRLLAIAASLALLSATAPADAKTATPKVSTDGSQPVCALGTFHCAPRPISYAMCRPNAMLEFYDPTLTKDSTLRPTAKTYGWSDSVDGSSQTVYHMRGNVKLQRADQQIQSDAADYNDQTSDYDARGNVRYQEAGQLLAATHMRGNQDASTGIADNVQYQMLLSHGNGVAKQGQMYDDQHTRYYTATYSTCDIGHHVWDFHAKNITINKDTGVGTARSAVMRFGNVPFLYLPYFSFPIDSRRKTGFLYPLIGNTSHAGFMVSAPYYLNLAPNYDATLDPRYYSERGPMLGGEFRYMVGGSNGVLDVQYVPHDMGSDAGDGTIYNSTPGDDRYLVKFIDTTHLWKSWSLNTSINRASDASYFYDFGSNLYNTSIGTLSSSIYANGGGTWWNASIGGDSYQNVNPFVPNGYVQYDRLPRATLNLNLSLTRWLEFGMNNEAVAFSKSGAVEGKREDLYPYLEADFGNSAWFVRPRVAYRYTDYQLDGNYQHYGYGSSVNEFGPLAPGTPSPFTSADPSRSVPITSVDSGLIFDRSTSLFGTDYTQTLEPRLYYLYVPYRNQNNLPLFDTGPTSFDYWQLFSPNQYSGADRQMNANNLTAALTTRLLDSDGVERLSASFGQIRYFNQQLVQLPNTVNTVTPATNWAGSDYVAQLNMQFNDQWRLSAQYQWNPNLHQTDLGVLELQHRLANDGIINFSYRYRRFPDSTALLLEQYSVSAVYPISANWRLVGSWTYSQLDKTTIEALAGVEYDSCCVAFRIIDRNYVNLNYLGAPPPGAVNNNSRNSAIMFEVEFKGLGSSSNQIEPLLRRDILGYQ
jgi:LPS-assembly protein